MNDPGGMQRCSHLTVRVETKINEFLEAAYRSSKAVDGLRVLDEVKPLALEPV